MAAIQKFQISYQGENTYAVMDIQNNDKIIYDGLTKEQARAKARDLNEAHEMQAGRELKNGLTLDAYTVMASGEVVFRICDNIGVVDQSIFPHKLDKYFKE